MIGTLFVTFFTNHVYVTTPSMYPTMPPGSLVFIERQSNYHVGDVIEFRGNGLDFMHRIIGIDQTGNITTKGDNPENAPDQFFPPTTKADVIGKAVLAPRWVGFPELIAHQPSYGLAWLRAELGLTGKLLLLAASALIIFGSSAYASSKAPIARTQDDRPAPSTTLDLTESAIDLDQLSPNKEAGRTDRSTDAEAALT